jgi:hypothetical protein
MIKVAALPDRFADADLSRTFEGTSRREIDVVDEGHEERDIRRSE